MNKLNIYICENFFPEFNSVLEKEDFDDVSLVVYPCMCENRAKKIETDKLLQKSKDSGDDGIVICSQSCEVVKLVENEDVFTIRASNYCFNHLANESFIDYILSKGGYIIGLGWLRTWREHLNNAGFDKETAVKFYQEFCRELVFFDAGIDLQSEKNLRGLSEYLEIPYVIIPFKLEPITYMIKSYVFEWRLQKISQTYKELLSEAQAQCAEYSAIFDLMGKIAVHSNKRDTIQKVKEIFLHIFGANQFKYWSNDLEDRNTPKIVSDLIEDNNKDFLLLNDENRFCIKVHWEDRLYGVIDASDFLFPKYIEKYLNFAIEIVKICGLILLNNQQYEKIVRSEKELQYLSYHSYHDALTGLFNRTYINSILKEQSTENVSVFMFDIDKLKYVNDNFGHLEGDKIISNSAEILKKCFREDDVLARIGGDEFLAIVKENNIANLALIHDRICKEIKYYNQNTKEEHLKISISIGYILQETREESIEFLMRKADQNMYEDKMRKRA